MEYITDITVELETKGEKTTHVFPNENVIISKSTHLWMKNNNSNVESEFLKQLSYGMNWTEIQNHIFL
ncbi:hypothetical protein ABE402_05845 [Bacillus smithii]|uniref:hypothetical protein n=1 Tax=Bacillus smithii TaxID=1479 RepID=UPI003D19DE24